MFRIFWMLAALLLVGSFPVDAQERTRSNDGDELGAVTFLLGLRSELELTESQVARLKQVDADVTRLNQPLMARVGEIRRSIRRLGPVDRLRGQEREQFEGLFREARSVMETVQANNWAAMRQVGDILTQPQKERLAKLLQERGDNQRERSRDSRVPNHGN